MKNRIICLLFSFILILSLYNPVYQSDVFAEEQISADNLNHGTDVESGSNIDSNPKEKTKINGYQNNLNKAYKSTVSIDATIEPATGGRLVELQRYNSEKKKWTTIRKITTEDVLQAEVSFNIPRKYRKKTISVWRIFAPETNYAESAKSKKITLTTHTITELSLTADNACIYRVDKEGNGSFIYSKYMNSRCAMASTTKLMSAILLMESGLIDSTTKISKHAASTKYRSGMLSEGDIYKTHDLLYAMLLPSSNDAATAVAEKVGGSEKGFISMMNSKAKKMGLTDTHFRNPHGLDADGHYSTAAEVAKLTAYAYTFPEIRKCFATKTKKIKTTNGKKSWKLYSTNSIYKYDKHFKGGKTGTTDNAKCCFAGVYKYKGCTYVTVVLRCDYGSARWNDTKKLHEYIKEYSE